MKRSALQISALVSRVLGVSLALGTIGCTGTLDGNGDREDATGETPGAEKPVRPAGGSAALPDLEAIDCSDAIIDPGSRLIRLLSRSEYLNTLSDLIGAIPNLEQALAAYIAPSSLGVPQAPVGATEVEGFYRTSEVIASHIVSDAALLDDLAPCPPQSQPVDCARSFLEVFASRAYRAPLLDEEDVERHLALFSVGLETSYARGIELLVRGIVQSPRFLYQLEIGTSHAVSEVAVSLRPHELAARLSYTIWDTLPDDTLLAAALAGDLATEEGLLAQVDRMLHDPRGNHFVRMFLEEWSHTSRVLSIAKSESHYPDWPLVREATHDQALAFFDHLLNAEGGTLDALLTSRTTMVDSTLAPYYGVTAAGAFEPFDAPLGTPSGVLTLPAVMATFAKTDESSPIHRGVFVREALFCETPPAPPAEIPPAPEVDSGGSTRERLSQHVAEPACAGCHKLLDPVGLGLEHYDAIGLFRSEDDGKPVDATGELIGTDVDGPFTGAVELGERLLQSRAVEQCLTRQWFRYALSRFEDDDSELCMIKKLVGQFRAGGQSLHAFPRAIVLSEAFRYRRPSDAEVTP